MAKIDLKVNVERSQLDKLTKDVNSLSNKTIQLEIGGSQANTIEKKATAVRNLNTELGKLKESSGGASVKITGTANAMKQAKTATAETSAEMKNFWREIDTGAKQTVVFNGTMGETVRRMAIWRTIGFGLKAFTSSMKEALSTIKDVDAELVTVRKVTGFSDEKMASIERGAYATASKYGESAQDYLASVASFARAGYRDQAEALAELSLKTQIVGDTTANTANQFLLAVDKAYQYQGSIEKLTKVLDGANELDNKYATSIEKIAEGMGIVAPVAAQMHVTIDELAAGIGTITAVTQRSGAESARALRALFLNIAGDTKTEIDEGVTWTTGEIEGLRDIIKKYSKDAYEAAQESKDVIDPMKAMAGLAKSMKEGVLSEQELVQMVSDIGGKLRSSQLLAIIQNWDMYEAMLEDFKNAAGSADKEIENAMNSWERKVSVLKNSWAEFVAKTIDSGVIKGALDLLNELISGIGDLGTAIALVGTGISAWKLGDLLTMISKVKMLIGEFGGGLRNIVKYIHLYTTTQRAAKKAGIEYSDELLKQVVQHKANAAATAAETAATSTSASATNASAAASEADTTAKGAEATAINAATASLNMYHVAAVGVVAAISIFIFVANKLKQAQEEAAQAHEEAIRKAAQSAETARDQIDGLKKLRQEYLDIVDSETTETEKAKELDRWKQTLIETYGLEKSALEGVNAERKTGLGLIDEEIKKQRDQSIADLSASYDEAKQQMEWGSDIWVSRDLWDAYKGELFNIPEGGVPQTDDDILGWIGTDTYDAYEKIANKIAELRKRNNNLTEQEKELLSLLEKEYADLGARIEKYGGIYTEYNRLMAEAKLEEMGLSGATIESGKAYAEAVIEILRSNEALAIKKEMLSQLAALYPQFSKAVSDAASATGALADAEQSVEQKAAGAVAALNELRGANKGAEEAARGNIAALFDESNQLTDAAKAAMLADSSLADYTISQLEAERAAKQANYANLVAQLAAVRTEAMRAAASLTGMQRVAAVAGFGGMMAITAGQIAATENDIAKLDAQIAAIGTYKTPTTTTGKGSGSGSGKSGSGKSGSSSSSSKTAEDKKLTALKDRVTLLKSELSLMEARGDSEDKRIAKQRQIQDAIKAEADYLKSIGGSQVEINNLTKEWYDIQNKIQSSTEATADAIQRAVDAQLALQKAMNERNVSVYNASTGRWEWQANAEAVESALKTYQDSVSGLSASDLAKVASGVLTNGENLQNALMASGWYANLTGSANGGKAQTGGGSVVNYNFGGFTLSEAQAKTTTVYQLAQMAGKLNLFVNS